MGCSLWVVVQFLIVRGCDYLWSHLHPFRGRFSFWFVSCFHIGLFPHTHTCLFVRGVLWATLWVSHPERDETHSVLLCFFRLFLIQVANISSWNHDLYVLDNTQTVVQHAQWVLLTKWPRSCRCYGSRRRQIGDSSFMFCTLRITAYSTVICLAVVYSARRFSAATAGFCLFHFVFATISVHGWNAR